MENNNFDLKLFGNEGGGYFVEVINSPLSLRSDPAPLEISGEIINESKRRIKNKLLDRRAWEIVGQSLFEALLPRRLRDIWERSLGGLPRASSLCLRLDIRAPALATIPWEIIHDGACYLALTPQRPVVRYFYNQPAVLPARRAGPLNILLVVATPHDLQPLPSAEREIGLIHNGVKELRDTGMVGRFDVLSDATTEKLQRQLRHGYEVVHFIGHGSFEDERGYLILDDGKGRAQRLDGRTMSYLCQGSSPLLIFLNSCLGAVPSQQHLPLGAANAAVALGVPAVVAMQSLIEDDLAAAFAGEFYSALAEGMPLGVCVTEGRMAILRRVTPDRVDWAIPVLFSNAGAALFDLAGGQERRRREKKARKRGGVTVIVNDSKVGEMYNIQGEFKQIRVEGDGGAFGQKAIENIFGRLPSKEDS